MHGRSFALGFTAAALLAVGVFVGTQLSHPPTASAAPKAEAKPFRAGYVCVSELMKDYEKWQEKAKHMEEQRQKAAKELLRMRDLVMVQTKQVEGAGVEDKAKLVKELREAQRLFEDSETTLKAELDKEASAILKELFADVTGVIESFAEERGLDVVYVYPAHPKRGFVQHKGSEQQLIDLLMRTTAVNPVYLRDEVDLTADVVKRLNAKADREKK